MKQGHPCSDCDVSGQNLWRCLQRNCMHAGCSEQYNDHSTLHFKANQSHCVHMNLSSQRIWCYLCETEVFLIPAIGSGSSTTNSCRRSSVMSNDSCDTGRYAPLTDKWMYDRYGGDSADSDDTDADDQSGLVGLQNIANTCYMNAALQALSNTPPLTGYFMECGELVEANCEMASTQRKQPGLARSYHRLIKDLWRKNKRSNGFVVPSGILYGIRSVHPMFKGFQQHDTQEFLRCFMDQLHEELKEVTPPPPDILVIHKDSKANSLMSESTINMTDTIESFDDFDDRSTCSSPSQSEAEYETCDSGVSEQSSLSDEGSSQLTYSSKRSISPTAIINQKPMNISSSKQMRPNPIHSGVPKAGSQKSQAPSAPHRSIISDVFDGKLLSSVQCLTCDRVSCREETFQDLSLPIPTKDHLTVLHHSQGMSISQMPPPPPPPPPPPGMNCTDAVYQAGQEGWLWWLWNWLRSWFWGPAVSLHDCMAAFFSADELKGDNMYSCEKCNKLRNGIKFSRVLALPEMLCVHLKRFRHDLSYSSKISSPVHFPLTGLDMRPYLHKDCLSEVSTYDLTAVICHHGTVGGGHYTSFAKHKRSEKWFEYDDQLVTEVSPEQVQNSEAYVLFYRKTNPQMAKIRAQAMDLTDICQPQPSDIRFFVSRQWLNRFNTFAEPGPIDNWALLCPHGGLPPYKAALVNRLVVPLPQSLWDFLYKNFGGGPACNHLYECDLCRVAAELLTRRQKAELEEFSNLNDDFQYHDHPDTIYAISMAWFRQWQLFARGLTNDEPGPINNKTIAAKSDAIPVRAVCPGSDYAQINTNLWRFFYGIYGGGPEIVLRGNPAPPVDENAQRTVQKETPLEEPDEEDVEMSVSDVEVDVMKKVEPPIDVNVVVESQPIVANKVTKNVSFEDCDMSSVASSDAPSSGAPVSDASATTLKRSKHQTPYSSSSIPKSMTNPELLGKKDKKYRGMKSNGLFGVEGKYSSNSISDAVESFSHPSNVVENGVAVKDEMTPLMHLESSAVTNGNDHAGSNTHSGDGVVNNNNTNHHEPTHDGHRKSHSSHHHGAKSVSRRKLKVKSSSSRRSAALSSSQMASGDFSDSDR